MEVSSYLVYISAMPPSQAPTPSTLLSDSQRKPVSFKSRLWSCSDLDAGQKRLVETKLEPLDTDGQSIQDAKRARLEASIEAGTCALHGRSACRCLDVFLRAGLAG